LKGTTPSQALCEENTAVVRETVEACDSGLAVDSGIHADGKGKSKYANGFWRELWVLLRYKGLPRAKHPLFISLRVLLYILLAALLSSFFYSQDRQLTGIFNTIGILFIAVILPCFMAQVFVEEMKFDQGGVHPGVQRRLLPRGHLRRRPDPDRDTLPVPQRRHLRLGAVLVHRD
jgi:hypothetical protein